MFNQDFWPTPLEELPGILNGVEIANKIVLEPSAGFGNIVQYLQAQGAKEVIACEKDQQLKSILQTKCEVIADDFLKLTKEDISHVQLIVMNPPFTRDEQHILHAWSIAPDGCEIVALCNWETLRNPWSQDRKSLKAVCSEYGASENLGQIFKNAERKTEVEIGKIRLFKPSDDYQTEFSGFFMDEEDRPSFKTEGLITYDVIRDLVNRYVEAVKVFDEQLQTAYKMNSLTSIFGGAEIGFSCHIDNGKTSRAKYKKSLQKSAWKYIFSKLNLNHLLTSKLREEINKFVETQEQVPFTERNIYHLLDMVYQTRGQMMDKVVIEVFEELTKHYHENRYNVEGWKTNSHYMLNEKFIIPSMTEKGWHGEMNVKYGSNTQKTDDLNKALCYLTGAKYNDQETLYDFCRSKWVAYDFEENIIGETRSNEYDLKRTLQKQGISEDEYTTTQVKPNWGEWHEWGFFEIKGFKKGTMHFRFKDRKVWELLNRKIAEIKGFPLPEKNNDYYSSKVA